MNTIDSIIATLERSQSVDSADLGVLADAYDDIGRSSEAELIRHGQYGKHFTFSYGTLVPLWILNTGHRGLQAKVFAVNLTNHLANVIHPRITAALEPFVGRQVVKSDNTLMERVRKVMPELPHSGVIQTSLLDSRYSLAWRIKTHVSQYNRENSETGHAIYHEETVYVGDLRNRNLVSLHPVVTDRRTDYTFADVVERRQAAEKLRRDYEDAKANLYPFGEG